MLLVGMLAVLATPMAAPAASADDDTRQAAQARLHLTALTGLLGPGSTAPPGDVQPAGEVPALDLALRVLVENTGELPLDSLRVVTEVYPPVSSRAALHRALGDTAAGVAPLVVHGQDVREASSLPEGDLAGIEVEVSAEQFGGRTGVFPVRVAVVRGTVVLDELVTAVVWLDVWPSDPRPTTMVWPLQDAPWRSTGGAYPITTDRATRAGGRLDALVSALEQHPEAPVVLAIDVHLLEDLLDRADGFTTLELSPDGTAQRRTREPEDPEAQEANRLLQRIRAVATGLPFPPMVGPYGDADLVALTGSGGVTTALAGEAAVESRRRGQQLLERRLDGTTHLLRDPPTDATLELLPGDQLLLPHTAMGLSTDAGDLTGGAALRPVRTTTGRLLTAIVADPVLTEALDGNPGSSPLVDVQRLVAETAVGYLEGDDDVLVLLPHERWDPDPVFATAILDRVLTLPWLLPMEPSSLVARGRIGSLPAAFADPVSERFDDPTRELFIDAVAALDALSAARPTELTAEEERTNTELRDQLLRASSRALRGDDRSEAEVLLRDVLDAVESSLGTIEVISGSQITLTSETGQVPVTLERTRGGPVLVEVAVDSQGRLQWPDGRRSSTLLLEPDQTQTVTFTTNAVSTGTFPVTVRVTDPTGTRDLVRTTVSVRATAVSGPALTLIALLVIGLLLAGSLRRNEPRPPRLEVV